MASNTSGITRTVNRSPARITTDLRPVASFPNGEYATGRLGNQISSSSEFVQMDDIDMEGDYTPTFEGKRLYDDNPYDPASGLPSTSNAQSLMDIAGKTEDSYKTDTGDAVRESLAESRRLEKGAAAARATSGILKATGAVINANAKYEQTAANNAFAIQQAQQQSLAVASQAHYKMLKEETKGKARGQSAMISAVAQGQAAGGDLAKTAISNEDVYAAEQSMILEINAMRQVFGLETQQRQLEHDTRMADINRDSEISQAIIGGFADVGMAGAGVMK